ncbi:MAG: type II secretion system F family protein [Candidatus Omnitrophica bacterium]|nr:type II secretion system F family protein [Candidatus Omnitrophota bacterium]
MTQFSYTAKTGPFETVQGFVDAESQEEAIQSLVRAGCFPVSINAIGILTQDQASVRLGKISKADIALFTNQLAGLIGSGVVILEGLQILSKQTPNKHLKAVINDLINKVRDGQSLAKSFATYPRLFSSLYVAMLHSGEMSGKLEATLKRLAEFLEKDREFTSSVRSSLIYPFFIFAVGSLTVFLLLTFVIPRLVTMFKDMGQALPLPTQILVNASIFWQKFWPLVIVLTALAVFSFNRWRTTPAGKPAWDTFRLRIPLFGEIILKTEISRLMQTLSLLIAAGMEIIQSLDIASSVLDNEMLKKELSGFREKIRMGASLSSCLIDSGIFPGLVTSVIAVGEETGTMEVAFKRIADEYEKDVERTLKTLTQLLEPMIILVMGLIVGFIVLAMLLPIFQINMIMK